MRGWLLLGLLLTLPLAAEEPIELIRKISSLELVGDRPGAIEVARRGVESYPGSSELRAAYIFALARGGEEQKAVEAYHAYRVDFPSAPSPELTEAVAWGVIERGTRSTPLLSQLAGLVGAVMTQGVQAVDLLLASLDSPNSLLRAISAELAGFMGDGQVCERLLSLLREERVSEVRVELIRALGRLEVASARSQLEQTVGSMTAPIEERLAAIEALVAMTDQIEEGELRRLLTHSRAGMRQLGCQLIAELDLRDKVDLMVPLLKDARPDVRVAALSSLGLLRVEGVTQQLLPLLDDPDPMVSITASWLLTLSDPEEGMHRLARWILSDHPEWARRAAAAVAATGRYGLPLARQWVGIHPDPFVRANLALGLIGQREEIDLAGETLYQLFEKEKGRWMWDEEGGELFAAIAPSQLRYKATIPNFPEVASQTTRLELLSVLAAIGHPKASELVRTLLKECQWRVTGIAAVTLLGEGDELAIDLVRNLLGDADDKVRVQAALALAIWGHDPSAVEVLMEAYPRVDRDMKLTILEGIGQVGAAESLPFLIDRMGEPYTLLRLFAASALIQSMNQSGGKGLEPQEGEIE